MFGHKARECRVYQYGQYGGPKFGCVDGRDRAVSEMRKRVTLWNQLVELEIAHRAQVTSLLPPELAAMTEEKEQKAKRRAWFALPESKAQLAELDQQRRQTVRDVVRESGLWWGNSEEVVASYEAARRKPGELRFHAWRRTVGKLTVRFQQGLLIGPNGVLPPSNRFSMEFLAPPPGSSRARVDTNSETTGRSHYRRALVRLQIASDERRPVWATALIVWDRPLPEGGKIRSASLLREPLGPSWRWKLVVVVELPETMTVRQPRGTGIIAFDLGWRHLVTATGAGVGLRVAAWRYDRSPDAGQVQTGTIVLDEDWLKQMRQVENLISIRQNAFNAMQERLIAWLGTTLALPEDIKALVGRVRQWRRPAQLSHLVRVWRGIRFDGDAAIYPALEAWRQHDKHLDNYESHLRDQMLKERLHRYRQVAAWVAREFVEVRLEKFNLHRVARRPVAEQKEAMSPGDLAIAARARHARGWAAVSLLRLAIINACQREGVTVTLVPAAGTTQTCSRCGAALDFDAARELEYQCPACGVQQDQDAGAAVLILAGGTEEFRNART